MGASGTSSARSIGARWQPFEEGRVKNRGWRVAARHAYEAFPLAPAFVGALGSSARVAARVANEVPAFEVLLPLHFKFQSDAALC